MLTNLPLYLANARKAIIQVLTLLFTVGTLLITFSSSMPEDWAAGITVLVGVIGSLLHYAVGNAPAPGTAEAQETGVTVDNDPDVDMANPGDIPNEEPTAAELDEGPVVNEIAVTPSVGKHTASN